MNILILILALSFPSPSIQHPAAGDTLAAPPQPADVSAFLDAFFEAQMEALHVPGAVFLMVRDSTILVAKGYGYADLEANRRVDPATTLFQVASVSKLFTATAVMLMVEQGQVNLDADVNQYLQTLQVEHAFEEPVTLAYLLTHTAGFDERNIGYAARDAVSVRPLGTYLADRMPPRTIAPGTVISYSNHGFGLAGLLVEDVSGEGFARYIEKRILYPLGMQKSTFDLPLPDSLAPHLARGYRWTGETYEPLPLLFRNVPPAGALSVTANDMARFVIAHLNNGRYGNTQLLKEATALEMHRQQFTHHPRLPGMAYGFMEQDVNGHRVLEHGGDALGYRSLVFLLPEQKTGFFVAYNASSSALRKELVTQFMDRFYPPSAQIQPLTPDPNVNLKPYTGAYRLNRYGRRSLEKLLLLFNGSFYVWSDSAGYLVTQDGKRWVEVEPLLFRQAEQEAYLAFQADDRGQITHLFRSIDLGGAFPGAYEKLAWYETPTFVNEFYLSWIPLLLFTWVLWPITAGVSFLWRRWKKRPRPKITKGMRAARWLAALFSIGMIWFAVGFIQKSLRMVEQGGGELLYGMPPTMNLLLWIPIVQVGLLIVLLGFTIQAWRKNYWSLIGRLHYTVVTLAALAWILFAVQYNLIGHLY
ncbi:MAG: serine hydrolase domain-containing protein [Rhodothermales bacterium]